MWVWISGGGTAGHVYPALTVLDESGHDPADARWVGMADSLEAAIVGRRGLPFRAVSAGPVLGTNPVQLARNVARLVRGTWSVWRDMGRRRPDVVLVTGGYVCVPVALAARLRRVPLAVFLPDVVPGHAVRLVARLADRVAASTEAALELLPAGKAEVTGYPVRRAVREADRRSSRDRLGLPAEGPIVLVFGGSRGARRINDAVAEAASELLARAALVHVSGQLDAEAARQARARLPGPLRARYRLYDFLHDEDMAAALAAADLVVSRAGAAVLGEYPARGLPSVLVPLPIAGGHQAENAAVLAAAGAAVIVDDAALDGRRLVAEVEGLMDDPDRLEAMGRAARAIDRPAAPAAVWHVLTELADQAVRR